MAELGWDGIGSSAGLRTHGRFLARRVVFESGLQADEDFGARFEQRLRFRFLDVRRIISAMVDQLIEHFLDPGDVISSIAIRNNG